MKRALLIYGIVMLSFSACQKNDGPDTTYTSTFPVSGEWWVTLRASDGTLLVDYSKLLTYNLSSNKGDSIWVDDLENIWVFKVKAACDVKTKTFSVDSTVNQVPDYPINVIIMNGKVISDGGITKGGNVTDSIYMQIGFSDGDDTYVISGVRRTGFKADEY